MLVDPVDDWRHSAGGRLWTLELGALVPPSPTTPSMHPNSPNPLNRGARKPETPNPKT